MLGTRRHIVLRAGSISLQSADLCPGKTASQESVLARSFRDASPARVARHIDHGRKIPADPVRSGFLRRHMGGLFKKPVIERSCFRNCDREYAAEAVNYIKAYDQRDPEPRLLYSNFLQFVRFSRIIAHDRADEPGADLFLMKILLSCRHETLEFLLRKSPVCKHFNQFGERHIKSSHDRRRFLIHLPDFFLQGHL